MNEHLTQYVHPTVVVPDTTRLWHFSVILADVTIGEWVSIGSHCEVGRGTSIGPRSRIGSFTFLPSHTRIGTNVFIGPHVMCCDDRLPKVQHPNDPPYVAEPPWIDDDAVIGAGALLLPGVRIGKRARIAAGAVVTKDVPDDGCVMSPIAAVVHEMPPRWASTPLNEDAGVSGMVRDV